MWRGGSDCDRLVDTVFETFGRCDVFVNNAGMSPLYPDLTTMSEEYYDKVTGVNLKGPFRLGALVGTRMAAGEGGFDHQRQHDRLAPARSATSSSYSCAKAGLNALTIGLAEAFGPKVRVNCILPGAVLTDIADAWSDEQKKAAARGAPSRAGRQAGRLRRSRVVAGERRVGVGDGRAPAGGWRHLPPDELTERPSNSVLR